MARGFNEVDPIMEPAYQEEMQFRALCDTLPEFNLNLTLREIHTLMHFLELGMEGDDVDKFESTFVSKYDHECFDVPATRTIEKKLRDASNYYFTEFNLPI